MTVFLVALLPPQVFAGSFNKSGEQVQSKTADTYRQIIVDNRARQYMLYKPTLNAGRRSMPLVIVLHGTFGTGKLMKEHLGFDAYADQHGFIVAYPDAFRKSKLRRKTTRWNDGRGTLESTELGVDDVRFIKAMIEDIARETPLDRDRIYATGASNGGIMTYRLGCELKGTFAAIAPVIANLPVGLKGSCCPESGISVLSVNGAADPVVPLNGGIICAEASKLMCEGGEALSRQESIGKFAIANGCLPQATSEKLPAAGKDGTWVEKLTYTGCSSRAEVLSYVVHGMGHVWPPRSTRGGKKMGNTSQNLDATRLIVDFFLRHRLSESTQK